MIVLAVLPIVAWVFLVVEIAGILAAIHALMSVRSERGTIAWCLCLVLFPFISLPFYFVFGRTKFSGYREALRNVQEKHEQEIARIREEIGAYRVDYDADPGSPEAVLDKLSPFWFTSGNALEVLVDGQETFDAIFDAIASAEKYVLVQFYIVRDDTIGTRLKEHMLSAAERGVQVYFLYDRYGSQHLGEDFIEELKRAGVQVASFGTGRKLGGRFEINFRNHRKIVIADGRVALIGGHNVGDEYMGESEWAGPWRDTHVRIEGPGAIDCQLSFTSDWFWATEKIPQLNWTPVTGCEDCAPVLILPSGPTQDVEMFGLALLTMIISARKRCWIASPYFVPDEAIISALKFAALRGVDVRIIIPEKKDHWIVYMAAFSFLDEMEKAGVKMLRYQRGFMHQKAFLIDDHFAGIGTANLDQRSFALNFEITAIASGGSMVTDVERMFDEDLKHCRPAPGSEFHDRGFLFRVGVRIARLFNPIL